MSTPTLTPDEWWAKHHVALSNGEKVKITETEEKSGSDVSYYVVKVGSPKRLDPYSAECEDIIEALGMTFAEGCAFKAIWRSCAARTLGKRKTGQDEYGVYDAEKVVYYGNRMVAARLAEVKA